MKVSEIRGSDSLQAWLEALPQETDAERDEARRWAVAIAHRASFRASTTYINSHLHFGDLLDPSQLIELFRSLLLPMVFIRSSNELRKHLSDAAKGVPRPGVPVAPQFAGIEAARTTCLMLSSYRFALLAREAIDYASDTLEERAFWLTVLKDCRNVSGPAELHNAPIWPSYDELCDIWPEENPIIVAWYENREIIQGLNEGWRFWVDWYDTALHGRAQDYDLLTKIALIDPEDWEKGADHVNALIADIRLRHLAETRPLGEDAIDQDADGVWHRVGRSEIDRDILQDACDSVRDEIARLRDKLQGAQGNMFTALVADLDLLDERLGRYPDRPLRLHDTFLRVQGHIARKLESRELPDDDLVRDLSSVLGNAALDMCNACKKTQEVVKARIKVRFSEADVQTRTDLTIISSAAATLSDAALAQELREDAEEVVDASIPLPEKTGALYRLQTRLAKIATQDGRNIVRALKEIGAVKAGVEAYVWIVQVILRFFISG